jgi:hypothetical protein
MTQPGYFPFPFILWPINHVLLLSPLLEPHICIVFFYLFFCVNKSVKKTYLQPSNKSLEVGQLAAATAQVKLCLYNEEEPAIWFHPIEAQFTEAGIKSQKLRYTNTNLPKQVLRDILDKVDT